MIEKNIELKVIGILWEKLFPTFDKALNCLTMTDKEIVLFCDYSSFDIPTGFIFSEIKDPQGNTTLTTIVLKKVTQEFAYSFDSISKGFKTICKFEFPEGIPKCIENLNLIGDWYGSNTYLTLGNVSN